MQVVVAVVVTTQQVQAEQAVQAAAVMAETGLVAHPLQYKVEVMELLIRAVAVAVVMQADQAS